MTKQIPLTESVKLIFQREGDALLTTVREVVLASGVKQSDDLALTLGVKPSQLSSALNGKGYNFDVRWLPGVLHIDQHHRLLMQLAGLVDCRVEEAAISDAEYRRRMEAACRRAGPVGEALRRDALDGDEP